MTRARPASIRGGRVVDGTGEPAVRGRRRRSTATGSPRSARSTSRRDASIDADGLVRLPRLHRHARALRPAAPCRARRTRRRSARASRSRSSARTASAYAPVDRRAPWASCARSSPAGTATRPASTGTGGRVGEYLDRLDAAASRSTPCYLVAAGHGAAAARWARTTGRPTAGRARRSMQRPAASTRLARGRGRAVQPGSPTRPACTPTTTSWWRCARSCAGIGGFYCAAPPQLRRQRARRLREIDRDRPRAPACRSTSRTRTSDFRVNAAARPSCWRCSTPPAPTASTSRSTPIRTSPAPRTCMRCCRAGHARGRRRTRRRPAARPRRARADPRTSWRTRAPTAATACRWTGRSSWRAAAVVAGARGGRSGRPAPFDVVLRAARRRALARLVHRTTSATRRTSARSCGTRGTRAAATASSSATTPHPRGWGTFPRYLARLRPRARASSRSERRCAKLTSLRGGAARLPTAD